MAFDDLRTGYAARKAARAAAANGQPNDLPAGEQADARGPGRSHRLTPITGGRASRSAPFLFFPSHLVRR